MLKRKLTPADWFLLVANLLPVFGVWIEQWSAWEAFLIYCLETIIVGLFTIIKLAIMTFVKKTDWWQNQGGKTQVPGLVFIMFFVLHYGIFVGVQMGLFFSFSQITAKNDISLLQFLTSPETYLVPETLIALSIFIIGYGYQNFAEFITTGNYRTKPMMLVMFEPYGRIFIQQITVLVGALALGLGAGVVFIGIFACIKIYFALYFDLDRIIRTAAQRELNNR